MFEAQFNILIDFCQKNGIDVLIATKYITEKRKRIYDPQMIIRACCRQYGITRNEFYSKSREQKLIFARFSFYVIAFHKTNLNKSQIAAITKHNHATVINGIKQADNLYETHPIFKTQMDGIVSNLNQEHNA